MSDEIESGYPTKGLGVPPDFDGSDHSGMRQGVNYPTAERYVGDPDFQERQFTDTHGYVKPLNQTDAFTKSAQTNMQDSIDEAASNPSFGAPIFEIVEPGRGEFTYGKGLMVPVEMGPGPTAIEEMKAIMRTNSADPTARHTDRYADWVREKVEDQ